MPREPVKHYFWMCLWGFLKEINIWFSWLSKDSHLHQCEKYHLISWEFWWVTKREKRENSFSLLGRVHPFFPAFRHQSSWFSDLQNWGFTPSAFLALWFFNTDWIASPIFLIVQIAGSGTSQPLQLYDPIPITNLLFYIRMYLAILMVMLLERVPINTISYDVKRRRKVQKGADLLASKVMRNEKQPRIYRIH